MKIQCASYPNTDFISVSPHADQNGSPKILMAISEMFMGGNPVAIHLTASSCSELIEGLTYYKDQLASAEMEWLLRGELTDEYINEMHEVNPIMDE